MNPSDDGCATWLRSLRSARGRRSRDGHLAEGVTSPQSLPCAAWRCVWETHAGHVPSTPAFPQGALARPCRPVWHNVGIIPTNRRLRRSAPHPPTRGSGPWPGPCRCSMTAMEAEFLAWLAERLGPSQRSPVGLRDDAAVLDVGGSEPLVITTDLITDGVHFRLDRDDPRQIGHKALAVNLSDVAAMAARPLCAFVSLLVPARRGLELAQELYEGLLPLAERFGVEVAGGDTNTWSGPLVVNVALIGQATERGPLRRDGAKPGDQLLVTGCFGGSLGGHHLDFVPRVTEALTLHRDFRLHAGVDCSDGLSLDVSRICAASGCGAVIETAEVPIRPAAVALAADASDGCSALEHALSDGEDFELILAVPPDDAARIVRHNSLEVPLTRIGEFVAEPGLWQLAGGERRRLIPCGYEHGIDR
ncbi:MAG: thiamine-phosphate kinase [Planctomycetota bacterium]|nr:MAG: thiamine-phosphate kinase [Planctomycetota bacterium]REK29914.1 MAG: thiamine-phosphate kinase [Planctomycetota bacterium]REK47916.1 MAG: thiamine-phosphate kinase [Planctomycetota bacterium]